MKQNHLTMKTALLGWLILGGVIPANAQFGGLLKKAKQKIENKIDDAKLDAKKEVYHQAKETLNEQSESVTAENNEVSQQTVNISFNDYGVDYSKAKQTVWNYESPTMDFLADVAYWCQRLRNSLQSGKTNSIDFDALSRINNGIPSFSFLEKQYHQWSGDRNIEAVGNWANEKSQLVKAAWKIISNDLPQRPDYAGMVKGLLTRAEKANSQSARNYYFDRAFETTSLAIKFGKISAGDADASSISSRLSSLHSGIDADMKANYPSSFSVADIEAFDAKRIAGANTGSEQLKMKKGALLTQYKATASRGNFQPMISGHATGIEELVKQSCPEWGTILASKKNTDYRVNYNALGKPVSRYHTAVVVCQDQGYKVMHYIQLSQPYQGGKYGNSAVRSGGMEWNAACSIVK